MKKYLLLLMATALIAATGCTKTTETVMPSKAISVDIASENWGTIDQVNWIADIGVPEITEDYTIAGATLIYRKTNDRDFEQWPVVYQNMAYSYIVRNGRILFSVNHTNGQTPIARPAVMTFKVVLVKTN
jgi:hypothetical protein